MSRVRPDKGAEWGMPVEKWTPERRRQLTRDALLDAAAVVFARRGFHGASLDEIAETAGFTRGAIYKNFGGKDEIFLALNRRFNERYVAEVSALVEPGTPLESVDVAAIAAKWRELATNDPDSMALGLEFSLYALRNPEVRERSLAQRRANVELIAYYVADQSDIDELAAPIEDLAQMFAIMADGFQMAAYADPDTARLFEPFLEMFMNAMTGPTPRYYERAKRSE